MNTSQKVFLALVAFALVAVLFTFRGQLSVVSADGCTYEKLLTNNQSFENFDELNLFYGAHHTDDEFKASGFTERSDGVYSKVCTGELQ